jgi:tetratricopeptide (TPR) repeat protein
VQTLTLEGKVHGPVAAGIAIFPFSDFKKTELIPNCQKALLHGALEDEGIITVFNALSLNVSGDIYYGEGDIPRAIKEYRRGLAITPNDVNLLNSLGVSYAMMNRHTLANDCFLQALSIHDHNFMAWYNLGLGRELQNDLTGAVVAFERAYSCPLEGDKDTANVRHELPLQLAKLYCQIGQYQKCLDILLPWHNAKQEKSDAGPASRALRFLGESFHGLGRTQEAIIALQRAIHFDECDADALSLLGEIYLDTNAGNQIALKLCGKSIELNPVPILFHLRLAKAMISCGYLETALVTLRPCLRDQKTKGAARVQMGLLYKKWGKNTTAIRWLNKALTQPEIKINENENEKEWHQQALSSLTELSEK